MKRISFVFFILAILCTSTNCSSKFSKDPNDYVGEYVFRPYNSDTAPFADFIILKKDFKVVEIRFFKSSGRVSMTEKRWYLYSPNARDKELVIGNFGHPIKGVGSAIKLMNNYDLGTYYEKVR